MDTTDGFVPIIAMFYSVFHPTEGTKVIHQVPSGVVVPSTNDDNRINNTLPDSSALEEPLFDFNVIKNYVIPKPSLCNKLITFKIDKYRVLGFPVNIYAAQYARNSFGFNFCFVFSYESDTTPYEGNIKRIGKMFRALEEQSQLLSKSLKDSHVYYQQKNSASAQHPSQNMPGKFNMNNKYLRIIDDWDDASQQIVLDKKAPGLDTSSNLKISSVESLIQQIFQDLNNYSECMIPIDASNSVDLKLFPISPPPPQVHSYDVPIAMVKLDALIDSLWDPTLLKILPFINGINSISQISLLSNANLELTKECIRHLIHYKSITLIDIFQFSNHYMVTSSIGDFLRDPKMALECQDYVVSVTGTFSNLSLESQRHRNSNSNSIASKSNEAFPMISSSYSSPPDIRKPTLLTMESSSSNQFGNPRNSQITKLPLPSKAKLFQLYNSLNSNHSVLQWYSENEKSLQNIDIRKFITFGVRNRIIARVHRYPVCGKLDTSALDDIEFKDTSIGLGMGNNFAKANLNVSSLPLSSFKKADGSTAKESTAHNGIQRRDERAGINIDSAGANQEEEAASEELDSGADSDSESESGSDVSDTERQEEEDQFIDANDQRLKRRMKLEEQKLLRLMKHTQHMDSICTYMRLSKNEVYAILERVGEIEIIER